MWNRYIIISLLILQATSFSTFNSIKIFLSFFFFLKVSNILLRGQSFILLGLKKFRMVTIFFKGGPVTTLPSMWSCPFHICFYSIIMFSSFNKRKEISKSVARSFNYSIIFYVFDCLFVKTHPFPNEALAAWLAISKAPWVLLD